MSTESYPEHLRLRAVKDDSQKLGAFIDWLRENGFTICETYNRPESLRDGEFYPTPMTIEKMLAKYFEIDLDKIESEKRAMLDELRRRNGETPPGS